MTLEEFELALDKVVSEFWNSDHCDMDHYELAEFIRQYSDGVEFNYEFGDE